MRIEKLNEKIKKIRNHKNFRLYAAAVIAFISLFVFAFLSKQIRIWTAPPSSQSDYPILAEIKDDGMASGRRLGIDELSLYSDLVAHVEIKKIYDVSDVTYTPQEGSTDKEVMDKQGISSASSDMRRVDLKVKDIIKGEENRKIISIWEHKDALYALPELKPGDEFIFFMVEYGLVDGYVHTTIADGIYYLALDNKVYPARMTDLLKETSGMDYGAFKDRVKNHKSMEEIREEFEKSIKS